MRELATKALKIRRYVEQDFRAYVATLERTTNWGDEAEEELAARIQKMTEKTRFGLPRLMARRLGP